MIVLNRGDTHTDTDLHQPLRFVTFGTPPETNCGYATVNADKLQHIGHMPTRSACSRKCEDDFRGACAIKGNGEVAGHVKRVDHDDVFDALLFREESLTRHYCIIKVGDPF